MTCGDMSLSRQVDSMLALARESVTLETYKSDECLIVLVEPWINQGCLAEDDGVRMTAGVHELHLAYQQLLSRLKVPFILLPAMSAEGRLSALHQQLQQLQFCTAR